MLRKLTLAFAAAATLGLAAMAPTGASAAGGYGYGYSQGHGHAHNHGGWRSSYGFWRAPRMHFRDSSCQVRRWVPTPYGPRLRVINRCY